MVQYGVVLWSAVLGDVVYVVVWWDVMRCGAVLGDVV